MRGCCGQRSAFQQAGHCAPWRPALPRSSAAHPPWNLAAPASWPLWGSPPPQGWLEWYVSYLLAAGEDKMLRKEDIRSILDGTLFYK